MPAFHFPLPYVLANCIGGSIGIETETAPPQIVCVVPIDQDPLAGLRTADMLVELSRIAHGFEAMSDPDLRAALRRAVRL